MAAHGATAMVRRPSGAGPRDGERICMGSLAAEPAAAPRLLSGTQHASLNYLQAQAGELHTWSFDPPDGGPRFNGRLQAHEVALADGRLLDQPRRLGPRGFSCVAHRSDVDDFWDEAALRGRHYPEAEALVRELTGARQAFVFDHTLRRRAAHRPPLDGLGGSFAAVREPVGRVHLDYTPVSGPARARGDGGARDGGSRPALDDRGLVARLARRAPG
ncbi:hypothetical protein IM725_17025 [Ramlibacter aquaticus]|uniref:Uncharacterized protein n=1 Tax=Ramlibacter aquaticus TaxID=2780094 RepID=A0ABR9SIS5_9BURK|nr:CmcJ/NvfI family oxidoreductase [Ramlibacter aquaticus]MBE7942276.1 hypothetical protein [Ramlibacter aquaticus]